MAEACSAVRKLELAENLAETCPSERGYGPDFGAPQFACHQSREGDEIVCAGWLATNGSAHPAVRMAAIAGLVPMEALSPVDGWPEVHETFEEVIEKLRATTPVHRPEYGDVPGWAVPTADPRSVTAASLETQSSTEGS